MLLELTRWLEQLQSLFGLFGYLTFRGILSALTALALSLWWGPAVIRRLAQLKGGQPIRKDGPQSHFSKAGTPTMGGALILLTVLASVLLWGDLRNRYVWIVLLVMLALRRDRLVRRLDQDRPARSERPEVALEVPAAVDLRPGRRPVPVLHRRRAGGDDLLRPVLQVDRAAAGRRSASSSSPTSGSSASPTRST